MMETILLDLMAVVEAEKEKYEQVYALSERKRDTIIEGNADGLEAIVQQEALLEKDISALETQRLGLIERLAKETDVPADEINIGEVAAKVSAELAKRMKNFKTEFIELLKKQMALNDINKQLLETQLQYIEVFINSLSSSININNTYGDDGMDADKNQRSGLIDHKI